MPDKIRGASSAQKEQGEDKQRKRRPTEIPAPRAMRILADAVKERSQDVFVYLEEDGVTIVLAVGSGNERRVLRRLLPKEAISLAEELIKGGSLFAHWA